MPLLLGDTTWGVLGFLHFNLHSWVPAEINALQAVASMLVQLQARIDAEERTSYNANHDELTGLPNRRALIAELKSRLDARRKTAVMVIDLDRFKVMNDFLGHGSGDRLLITIADRIRTSIRANDFAARLGGDEFVFIVDRANSEMEVLATAYRILDVISQPVAIFGQEVSHTARIGIALAEPGAQSELDLLGLRRRRDVRRQGPRTQPGGGLRPANCAKRSTSARAPNSCCARPSISVVCACTSSPRWTCARDGSSPPRRSCAGTTRPAGCSRPRSSSRSPRRPASSPRSDAGSSPRPVASWGSGSASSATCDFIVRINMSPADFKMGDLVDFVERCLRENNVPGNRLCIEITEYAVLATSPTRPPGSSRASRPWAWRSPSTTSAPASPR